MLDIKCDRCKSPIDKPAALVFSPPKDNSVNKFHVCEVCWSELVLWVQGVRYKVLIGREPKVSKKILI